MAEDEALASQQPQWVVEMSTGRVCRRPLPASHRRQLTADHIGEYQRNSAVRDDDSRNGGS